MTNENKPASPTQWFNPEELTSLKGMEWLARKLAHEAITGLHASKQLGQGTDFSQYRSYMPGDDLRRVDWKVYGRTDRLYLKESELESRTRWWHPGCQCQYAIRRKQDQQVAICQNPVGRYHVYCPSAR
jgi:hypothetical protein